MQTGPTGNHSTHRWDGLWLGKLRHLLQWVLTDLKNLRSHENWECRRVRLGGWFTCIKSSMQERMTLGDPSLPHCHETNHISYFQFYSSQPRGLSPIFSLWISIGGWIFTFQIDSHCCLIEDLVSVLSLTLAHPWRSQTFGRHWALQTESDLRVSDYPSQDELCKGAAHKMPKLRTKDEQSHSQPDEIDIC